MMQLRRAKLKSAGVIDRPGVGDYRLTGFYFADKASFCPVPLRL